MKTNREELRTNKTKVMNGSRIPLKIRKLSEQLNACGKISRIIIEPIDSEAYLPERISLILNDDITIYFDMKGNFMYLINTK